MGQFLFEGLGSSADEVGHGFGTEVEPCIVEATGPDGWGEGGSKPKCVDVIRPVDLLVEKFFKGSLGRDGEVGIEPGVAEAVVIEEAIDFVIASDFGDEIEGSLLVLGEVRVHHKGDLVLGFAARLVGCS